VKTPLVDLLHFKNNLTDNMSQKIAGKVRGKNKGKYFKNNLKTKSENPLNFGKKIAEPEKNCRDFLISKIFVRFFQSNLPLAHDDAVLGYMSCIYHYGGTDTV
jgi:hypothetical protein